MPDSRKFGGSIYATLVRGYADGKAFDVDKLRLGLDESDDVGWGWLKLDVPQVKVPFVEQSSGRQPDGALSLSGRGLDEIM